MLVEQSLAAPSWHVEFATIISCSRCTTADCRKLLRDEAENIPQPGYIGARYDSTRVLLVGQNPGVGTKGLAARDRVYTAALRDVRQKPTAKTYESLSTVMDDFMPSWPVRGNYFPLRECGLTLKDIAYCNAVRCRTVGNAIPSTRQSQSCIDGHFRHWAQLLKPRMVVFIGKWAFDQCHGITEELKIPSAFMNRQRSLSGTERARNRQDVVNLVRNANPRVNQLLTTMETSARANW
jgi:uracil-DNA glycosylase